MSPVRPTCLFGRSQRGIARGLGSRRERICSRPGAQPRITWDFGRGLELRVPGCFDTDRQAETPVRARSLGAAFFVNTVLLFPLNWEEGGGGHRFR